MISNHTTLPEKDNTDATPTAMDTQNEKGKYPLNQLLAISSEIGYELEDLQFAKYMDRKDFIGHLRNEFYYPKMKNLDSVDLSLVDPEEDCVYFCGNSFGLCPKKTREYMEVEIEKWEKSGYNGFITGDLPWAICDECLQEDMGKIVGAKEGECALMNGLTVNLHLLLISFYNPTPTRYKIVIEKHAFLSDRYAIESQIRLRGYDPETALLVLSPRQDEHILRQEDILETIEQEGDAIATICLSGVQYYTGQKFDIPSITRAGQRKGCYVGWDLAHAAGNVELRLHDWGVDFACWCTYKYLNCGAGSLAGLFLHEKHFDKNLPQLQGWWGNVLKTRFEMDNNFDGYRGALRYRISSTPAFLCPPMKASLEVLSKTSMSELAKKSRLLTGYLEARILRKYGYGRLKAGENKSKTNKNNSDQSHDVHIQIFTPADPDQRGAQLSLSFSIDITQVHEELSKRGVLCDERKPDVLRVTPNPIYCSFEDVHRFMKYLDEALHTILKTRKS